MIQKLLYFIPAAVSLYWTVAFILKDRTKRQNILLNCLFLVLPYLVTYAFFCMPDTNMRMLCTMERIGLPVSFLLLGMLAIYINKHMRRQFPQEVHTLLLIPGLIYGAVLNVLYYIIGMDDAVRYVSLQQKELMIPQEYHNKLFDVFWFFDSRIVLYIGATLLLLLIVECMYVMYKGNYHFGNFVRFVFMGRQANPTNIIAMFIIFLLCCFLPMTLMRPHYMQQHQPFCLFVMVMMTVMLQVVCMAEYNSDIEEFTMYNIMYSKRYYERKLREREDSERLRKELAEEVVDEENRSYKSRRQVELLREFRRLMEEEQVYLDSDVSIMDVADKLNVGRTTLSGIVNQAYGKNFRTVINDYRIAYAKGFIKEHPLLTQEKMAFACGFKDASAFSHKFKDITGVTPLLWAKRAGV